jgi:hypothetical protein
MACKNDLLHVDFLSFPRDPGHEFLVSVFLFFPFSLARIYSFLFVITSLGKCVETAEIIMVFRLLLCADGLVAHLLNFISFISFFLYFIFLSREEEEEEEERSPTQHCLHR